MGLLAPTKGIVPRVDCFNQPPPEAAQQLPRLLLHCRQLLVSCLEQQLPHAFALPYDLLQLLLYIMVLVLLEVDGSRVCLEVGWQGQAAQAQPLVGSVAEAGATGLGREVLVVVGGGDVR